MAAEGDDARRAEALRRQHRGQTNRPVPDNGDGVAFLDTGAHRRVMTGRHDVRERQQRFEHVVRVAGADSWPIDPAA